MATNVVRKCSIFRTGVVLKTKTNLYFYRMCYRLSYFQNYYSIPNPIPIHFMTSFPRNKIVSFHTGTKSSVICTVLDKQITSIFRQPPEDTINIFLSNTAPQTTCYSNLDHIMFLHHWENLK